MLMHLLVARYPLMDYVGTRIAQRLPAADTFALLAGELDGVEQVERVELADQPATYAFTVCRAQRQPLLVVWDRRDTFDGESGRRSTCACRGPDRPPAPLDAFGNAQSADVVAGEVRLAVSDTPLFVSAP